jgi:hypothetical protein
VRGRFMRSNMRCGKKLFWMYTGGGGLGCPQASTRHRREQVASESALRAFEGSGKEFCFPATHGDIVSAETVWRYALADLGEMLYSGRAASMVAAQGSAPAVAWLPPSIVHAWLCGRLGVSGRELLETCYRALMRIVGFR